ncbi:outer membrane protein assembly factor BamB family protein [Verrucomicrobiota bacterium sgz303538]
MNRTIVGKALPAAAGCVALLFPGNNCSAIDASNPTKAVLQQAAKSLAPGTVTSDWPRFLGPANNASSPETNLLRDWPKEGPRKVWEIEKGKGWSCPAISGDRLVLLHRVGEREVIDCLRAENGEKLWSVDYAAPYQDRYGASDGPRTSPVIADGRVFTYGVTGLLHCLDLATGKILWKRDLDKELQLEPNFFGHGSTPLVLGERLILNVGGKGNLCAVALDTKTGKQLWGAQHEWGASYASPVAGTVHGRECVFIFAGGESRPPTGGLLTIDANTGEVLNATPHRADIAESVNASSPVVIGNHVFVTESYGSGGEMIEIAPDLSAKSAWKAEKFGAYFMTPIVQADVIYGFDGQSPRLAELVAYDVASGKELWRDDLGGKFGRGSLLSVNGEVLALGEFGDLLKLSLSRDGAKVLQRAKLFHAPETWTLPALSRGLLYVCQNDRSADKKPARLICYDLRE